MAGKRHHILPRFLLRGFASRIEGDEAFTFVYRKGAKSFESNITNVGVGTYFYGKDGEQSADDGITAVEGNFANLVDSLRETQNGRIDDNRIADFIVHLTGRTKHLRDSLTESTGQMIGMMTDFLSDERQLREWTVDTFEKNPETFNQVLDEELEKLNVDPWLKEVSRNLLPDLIPGVLSSLKEGDLTEFADMFAQFGMDAQERLPEIIREGHNKVLEGGLVGVSKADLYRRLHWFVVRTESPLILSDVGCIFETRTKYISLAGKDDEIVNVFLPLATECLLTGTSGDEPENIDTGKLNATMAECGREYFIAGELSENLTKLQGRLGKDAAVITEGELRGIVSDAFES